MPRGFFQDLEKGIESRFGEHVDLIDDEDLASEVGRAGVDPGHELAHVVDLVVAGGIELVEIERTARFARRYRTVVRAAIVSLLLITAVSIAASFLSGFVPQIAMSAPWSTMTSRPAVDTLSLSSVALYWMV